MKIYLGGVQGVGKSTLLKTFYCEHPEYFAISSSELLMSIFKVSSRKELEAVEIPDNVFVPVYEKYENIILDGDLFLAKEDHDAIDLFIFVTAPNEEILKRREEDKSRTRFLDLEQIKSSVRKNLEESLKIPKPVYVIENTVTIQHALKKLEQIVVIIKDKTLDEASKQKLISDRGFITTKELLTRGVGHDS